MFGNISLPLHIDPLLKIPDSPLLILTHSNIQDLIDARPDHSKLEAYLPQQEHPLRIPQRRLQQDHLGRRNSPSEHQLRILSLERNADILPPGQPQHILLFDIQANARIKLILVIIHR
jgi:hypothetical protein